MSLWMDLLALPADYGVVAVDIVGHDVADHSITLNAIMTASSLAAVSAYLPLH